MSQLSRRLLLTMGAAAVAAPAFARGVLTHLGDGSLAVPADPWAARTITPHERLKLKTAGARIMSKTGKRSWITNEMLENHYRIRIPVDRLFEPGKDHMTAKGVVVTTAISEGLVASRAVRMEIVCHAADIANSYGDYMRTERQANAIRAAMISRGIEAGRLKATGLGSRFPYIDTWDAASAIRMNGRVEFLIRPL